MCKIKNRLEAGTDIHSLDLNGKTVLHLAGTRLRWLINEENQKASPKLKYEAIMVCDYLLICLNLLILFHSFDQRL